MNLKYAFRLLKSSITGRILINTGWASAATPVNIGLGIIQIGIMARMIGPEGIGLIALLEAVCALFGSIFKSTSSETVMVYASKAETENDSAQLSHIIYHCYVLDALTSIVAFLAIVLSSFFSPRILNLSPGTEWLQILFGLTIVFQSTYWTSHGLLRFTDRFSWTFYQSCAHSIIKLVAMVALFLGGAGLTEVISLLVGLSLFDGASLLVMALMALHKKGIYLSENVNPWWGVSREVWRFQALGYARQIVKSMNRYVDILLIGYIASPTQVGFYRSGKQVCEQIITPSQGFLVSLFPEYSRLYFSGNMPQLRKIVMRFTILLMGFTLFVSLVLLFGTERIIRIVLGAEFLPATNIIHVLIISTVIMLSMYPLYSLPAAVGQAKPALKSAVASVCVQILVMFCLIPRYGGLGAAWAHVAYVATWAMVMLPSIIRVLQNGKNQWLPLAKIKEVYEQQQTF